MKFSQIVKSGLPAYIKDDYQNFADFIKLYYDWCAQEGHPTDLILNFNNYHSLDKNLDLFIDHLKSEYLVNVPSLVEADARRLIYHSKEFYKSKGTEDSIKFLMRILYGEDVEIKYPGLDVLRSSDGKWSNGVTTLITTDLNDVRNLKDRSIIQTRIVSTLPTITETATANVEVVSTSISAKYRYAILTLKDVVGDFEHGHPIYDVTDTAEENPEYVYPVLTSVTVTAPGSGYQLNDEIKFDQGKWFHIDKTAEAIDPEIVNLGVSTYFDENDIEVVLESVTLPASTHYTFDGQTVTILTSISAGDELTVKLPIVEGSLSVSSVDSAGELLTVAVRESTLGLTADPTFSTSFGTGATMQFNSEATQTSEGKFLSTDGFLSSDKVLQDGDFYQDFSYVVRVGLSLNFYKDTLLKLAHPAGLKLFGEVFVKDVLDLMMEKIDLDIDIPNNVIEFIVELLDKSSAGPKYAELDNFDGFFDETELNSYYTDQMHTDQFLQDNWHESTNRQMGVTQQVPNDVLFQYIEPDVITFDDMIDTIAQALENPSV